MASSIWNLSEILKVVEMQLLLISHQLLQSKSTETILNSKIKVSPLPSILSQITFLPVFQTSDSGKFLFYNYKTPYSTYI